MDVVTGRKEAERFCKEHQLPGGEIARGGDALEVAGAEAGGEAGAGVGGEAEGGMGEVDGAGGEGGAVGPGRGREGWGESEGGGAGVGEEVERDGVDGDDRVRDGAADLE